MVGLTERPTGTNLPKRHSEKMDDFSAHCGRAVKRTSFENRRAGQNRWNDRTSDKRQVLTKSDAAVTFLVNFMAGSTRIPAFQRAKKVI
jgi:hypothetical protein